VESGTVERGSSPVIQTRMPAGQWLFYGGVIQTNSQFNGGLVVLNGRWVHPIFEKKRQIILGLHTGWSTQANLLPEAPTLFLSQLMNFIHKMPMNNFLREHCQAIFLGPAATINSLGQQVGVVDQFLQVGLQGLQLSTGADGQGQTIG